MSHLNTCKFSVNWICGNIHIALKKYFYQFFIQNGPTCLIHWYLNSKEIDLVCADMNKHLGYCGAGDQRSCMKCDLCLVQQTWTETGHEKDERHQCEQDGDGQTPETWLWALRGGPAWTRNAAVINAGSRTRILSLLHLWYCLVLNHFLVWMLLVELRKCSTWMMEFGFLFKVATANITLVLFFFTDDLQHD